MEVIVARVKSVKVIDTSEYVYDVSVADNENLFVTHKIGSPPMLAHNCARDKPNSVWSYHQYVVGKQLTDARREQLWDRINKFESSFKISKRAREYPIQVFKKMLPVKLCGDKEFYSTYVASPFEECPLAHCCFKPKQLMATLKEAAANGPGE